MQVVRLARVRRVLQALVLRGVERRAQGGELPERRGEGRRLERVEDEGVVGICEEGVSERKKRGREGRQDSPTTPAGPSASLSSLYTRCSISMHPLCLLHRFHTNGTMLTAAAGGALSAALERRLANEAMSAAGRCELLRNVSSRRRKRAR